MCISGEYFTDDGEICIAPAAPIAVANGITNCCRGGQTDNAGNCCDGGTNTGGVCTPNGATLVATFTISSDSYYPAGQYSLYCSNGSVSNGANGPSCNGRYFVVKTGSPTSYMNPNGISTSYVSESFTFNSATYTRQYQNNSWGWYNGTQNFSGTPNKWMVKFGQ